MTTPRRSPSVRLRWPFVLLLVAIALTGLAVLEAQRAMRSHRAVAEGALRDYAAFAAWSYEQHLRTTLDAAAREVLREVNHGSRHHVAPQVPDARDLPHYLEWDASCRCHATAVAPPPGIFFGFALGADTLGVAPLTEPARRWERRHWPDRPGQHAVPGDTVVAYTPAERRWIVDTLTAQVRGSALGDPFPVLVGVFAGESRVLAYTRMPTSWGDTIVYGAEYSLAALSRMLDGVLDQHGLLPPTFTRGLRNRDIVAVQVRDGAGRTVYESDPASARGFAAETTLPASFGGLTVGTYIRPELAGRLVIGGLPRSRLPLLLALLGLAAGLSLVALRQLRRESELARLRADSVSSISHELRTPLAQIRLWVDTLRLGRVAVDDPHVRPLEVIERETLRLSTLVDRVLRFARTGTPEPPAVVPSDVAAEVQALAQEFRALAAERDARLEVAAESVPAIPIRPDALRHLLFNLLDNAVKFGPAGQTIRVRIARAPGEVHLSVADEGPGVPERERASIWHPFERGAAAPLAPGSGIGLTIVRDIAEQHGGRAWVDASPGGGAMFVVALPAPANAMASAMADAKVTADANADVGTAGGTAAPAGAALGAESPRTAGAR